MWYNIECNFIFNDVTTPKSKISETHESFILTIYDAYIL